jgi:hypothetical protein
MDWAALSAISEAVGAVGVIGSLLYVALQIRAEARARQAATVHAQCEAYRSVLAMFAQDEGLARIHLRGIQDFGSLEGVDLVRFTSLFGLMFRVFEEAFFQRSERHFDARVWEGYEGPIADLLAYPGVRAWWRTRSRWYGREFCEYIEAKLANGRAANLYPETAREVSR